MFGSDVLDVGIGLTLLFLIASLICSAVVEMIEGVMKARAMHMESGLRELLQDPNGELAEKLFKHPLVFNLFRGNYAASKLRGSAGAKYMRWSARGSLPSYIPAANFARAIMDFAGRGEQTEGAFHASPLTAADLRYRLSTLPYPALRRALASALDGAGDDLAQVQKNLEAWFDSTMDRVSGWYKRRSSYFLFAIGLAVAVSLNLDPIAIGSRLATDDALRERFVAEAQLVTQNPPSALAAQTAATAPSQPGVVQADPTIAAAIEESRGEIRELRRQLDDMGTPMGWRDGSPVQRCAPGTSGNSCKVEASYFRIALGWLMMALAVTLGAPFWFDLLNRFMIVRSTIKPHEKSPEEPPIDAEKNRQSHGPAPSPAAGVAAASGAAAGAAHAGAPERTESPLLPPDEDLDAPFDEPEAIPENEEVLV